MFKKGAAHRNIKNLNNLLEAAIGKKLTYEQGRK